MIQPVEPHLGAVLAVLVANLAQERDHHLLVGLLKNISLLHGVSQFNVSLLKLILVRGLTAVRSKMNFDPGNPERVSQFNIV